MAERWTYPTAEQLRAAAAELAPSLAPPPAEHRAWLTPAFTEAHDPPGPLAALATRPVPRRTRPLIGPELADPETVARVRAAVAAALQQRLEQLAVALLAGAAPATPRGIAVTLADGSTARVYPDPTVPLRWWLAPDALNADLALWPRDD